MSRATGGVDAAKFSDYDKMVINQIITSGYRSIQGKLGIYDSEEYWTSMSMATKQAIEQAQGQLSPAGSAALGNLAASSEKLAYQESGLESSLSYEDAQLYAETENIDLPTLIKVLKQQGVGVNR